MKRQIIQELTGKSVEPSASNQLVVSKIEMINLLNFYSKNADPKSLKKWAQEWAKANNLNVNLNPVDPIKFLTWGAVARIATRGFPLQEEEITRLKNKLLSLSVVKEKTKKDVSKQKRVVVPVNKTLKSLDGAMDAVVTGKKPEIIIDSSSNILEVVEFCNRNIDDLKNEDKQYDPSVAKKLKVLLITVLAKLENIKQEKPKRKPRKVKPKAPKSIVKQTENVQFLPFDETLNRNSLPPADVVGKTSIWVYDTKYQKLTYFQSEEGQKFSFKSTTLQNIDKTKSFSQKMKKSDIEKLRELNTKPTNAAVKKIAKASTTKQSDDVTGRFSKRLIILSVA